MALESNTDLFKKIQFMQRNQKLQSIVQASYCIQAGLLAV